MQYTGMTEMFGFVGEMFNAGFKPVARSFERTVHNRGDGVVRFMTKSNRPLKILGFMTGSFVIAAGGIVINRKLQMEQIIPPVSPFSNEYKTQILPRLQQALDTAFKYAQNGNIALLDPQLESIAEIVIEYPQFKRFVKYTQSMTFPKDTYFDAQHGGLPVQHIENKTSNNDDEKSDTSQVIVVQSESDTVSMLLSMDQQELQKEILKSMDKASQGVITFENQLDYIRHLCVIRRCEKIYQRGMRHAQKGNVQQCADVLAELWEYVCAYEVGPIIIGDGEGNTYKLTEEDLYRVMRSCHSNYVQYLINCAKTIGNHIDRKGLKKERETDMHRSLMGMVWKNLENARLYAEKYNIFDDEFKNEVKQVWKQKADQFNMEVV
eukprot:926896_1